MIRSLIVDDEALGRARIRALLDTEQDIEVVGEACDGDSALADIARVKPDLVFLDIEMPGSNGFEVLSALREQAKVPLVIFVTAYDDYAVRAFESHALDYLLKPFDEDRFRASLERARDQLMRDEMAEIGLRMSQLLDTMDTRPNFIDRLVIKSAGRVVFVSVDDIDWIEADGNYLHIHVGKESHLLRETMNSLEQRLDPQRFIRIHRSTLVNMNRVQELQPIFHGDFAVILRDGTRLTLSRGYRARVQERLGAKF